MAIDRLFSTENPFGNSNVTIFMGRGGLYECQLIPAGYYTVIIIVLYTCMRRITAAYATMICDCVPMGREARRRGQRIITVEGCRKLAFHSRAEAAVAPRRRANCLNGRLSTPSDGVRGGPASRLTSSELPTPAVPRDIYAI